jgi:asparagine synthetase B (glutamine-hydrolysing)
VAARSLSERDWRHRLVCNGEIYNSPELRQRLLESGHRFRTRTDVEVILHLYEEHGEDCVRHLRGMFAFAIWDARDGTLLLGKDHMGQKPLFFYATARASCSPRRSRRCSPAARCRDSSTRTRCGITCRSGACPTSAR